MTRDALPDDSASPPDDFTLMSRSASGDLRAFETLVERHQTRVIGTIAKMLGDETEAEDLAQQVFLRVWKSCAKYQPTAKFTTWLLTITRNLVFNEMRRRGRATLVSIEPREDGTELPLAATSASPSEEAAGAELQEVIARAIAALPEMQRTALILRRYEEMPYEEIAKVLGTTVPAVKSILFRARDQLRVSLASYLSG